MPKYTVKQHPNGIEYIEQDLGDGVLAIFAKDPANSDYQAYLKYLEENN